MRSAFDVAPAGNLLAALILVQGQDGALQLAPGLVQLGQQAGALLSRLQEIGFDVAALLLDGVGQVVLEAKDVLRAVGGKSLRPVEKLIERRALGTGFQVAYQGVLRFGGVQNGIAVAGCGQE